MAALTANKISVGQTCFRVSRAVATCCSCAQNGFKGTQCVGVLSDS